MNEERTTAIKEAITRAIQRAGADGSIAVADLGAGHGLYGMMAERGGAGSVTRYECLVPLAKMQANMAKSAGMKMRIRTQLPEKDSDDEEENQIPAADLAIFEVWEPTFYRGQGVGILGQGIVEAVKEARGCGVIGTSTVCIPRSARVVMCPCFIPPQTELLRCPMEDVSGFDLSYFSRFCPEEAESIYLKRMKHTRYAEPAAAFIFDFHKHDGSSEEEAMLSFDIGRSGVVNAIVFWHEMELDEERTLSSGPETESQQAVFMLSEEVKVEEGRALVLRVRRSSTELRVEPVDSPVHKNHILPSKQVVQRWHFGMLNDSERNEAYYRALRRQVAAGSLVLDVGSGTGLLGMMAARCGAGRVVCCEKSEAIATASSIIVEHNGLDDRVVVVHKHSSELIVGPAPVYVSGFGEYQSEGSDLRGRADMMVSEIVDCGLLGEGVIPSVLHARLHLLKEDAVMIPCAAEVFAMLIDLKSQSAPLSFPLHQLHGFDFSPFNQFRSPSYEQIRLADVKYERRSEEKSIFLFDFYSPLLDQPRSGWQKFPIRHSGRVNAVAFWFRLDLDEKESLLTSPDNPTTCWKQAVQFFEEEVEVSEGRALPVWVSHDQTRITFALRPPPPEDDE